MHSAPFFLVLISCLFHLNYAYRLTIPADALSRKRGLELYANAKEQEPLLLRAAKGEKVERAPVWMMRQAGRHMKVYQDLCKKHKTFRERSENADVATEIRCENIVSDPCPYTFSYSNYFQFATVESVWNGWLYPFF